MPLIDLLRKYPVRGMLIIGAILYMVSALLWWTQVYHTPQRAFQDMLAHNVSTRSVTKDIRLDSTKDVLAQQVHLQLGADNYARWIVTAKQDSNEVVTESIGLTDVEYVRYNRIVSDSQEDNKQYKRYVNQWGKQAADAATGTGLFYQAVMDINYAPTFPIGAIPQTSRDSLLKYIADEQVFTPDYSSVKTVEVGGRSAYQMTVAVKQAPYVRMLQAYEKAFGFEALATVSATQYQNEPDDTVTIAIDSLSHNLVRLSYDRTGYQVTYSDYGLDTQLTLPTDSIRLDELKQRLSSVGS